MAQQAVKSFCILPKAQVQFPASAWWFSTIPNSSAGAPVFSSDLVHLTCLQANTHIK